MLFALNARKKTNGKYLTYIIWQWGHRRRNCLYWIDQIFRDIYNSHSSAKTNYFRTFKYDVCSLA